MSLFRYLFPKKSEVAIGSLWVHESEYENPFGRHIIYKVEEIKSNWVKYSCYGQSGKLCYDSASIRMFYMCYRKIDKAPDNISFKD